MVEEKIASDFRAGVNINSGYKTGEMVYQSRQEKHVAQKQPVRQAMIAHRPDTRIQQYFPPRARCWVSLFDRVQIIDEIRNKHK
jgi:hypothetical protein